MQHAKRPIRISLKNYSCDKYIDIVIPRGGKSLMKKNLKRLEDTGNKASQMGYAIYIDEFAEKKRAVDITMNSKHSD